MSNAWTPFPLDFQPGVQRDGAFLDRRGWIDSQWVRFQRGKPRKIGGYELTDAGLSNNTSRSLHVHWEQNQGYVHNFHGTGVQRLILQPDGSTGATSDRTPAGFVGSSDYNWQVVTAFDEGSSTNVIIAHGAPNLNDIGSTTETEIYNGDITGTGALTAVGRQASGGVMVLQPYLIAYGSAGEVAWSDANDFTNWATGDFGEDRITGSKIVKGLPSRNRTGLLWSLDTLILMKYVGGTAIFEFTTISEQISILSSSAVIEFDGRYYWPGIGKFFIYDGRLSTLPNDSNLNHFFENLNYDQRQKVWALTVPRWGEIWWFYPSGNETECDRALIYNVHESERTGSPVWYDTDIERTSGFTSSIFRYPLMVKAGTPTELYIHDKGTDAVDANGNSSAINAYVETGTISLPDTAQEDQWMRVGRFEPDIRQTGDMTITVRGRKYARSSDVDSTHTLTASDDKLDIQEQRRHLRFRFTSNAVGGDFEIGQPIVYVQADDQAQH